MSHHDKSNATIFFNPIIVIKYGELALKGKNRTDFVSALTRNIKYALKSFRCDIKAKYDYLQISNFAVNEIKTIVDILSAVPGISVFYFGYELSRDLEFLKQCIVINIDDGVTFKIECKRKDKKYEYDSMAIIRQVAGCVLEQKPNTKVNLTTPQTRIYIEVLKNVFLVFVNRCDGIGGLPVNTSGRALVLLSGGIDSPVAAHMMMKRGMHVDFLTFITPPHTSDEALEKTKQLSRAITRENKLCNSQLYVCNFTPIIRELNHISMPSYKITILRRAFIKFAQELCALYNYDAIITGEALGQVASQTVNSLKTISAAAPNLLVLRPLIGFDKNEIISYAKKIKTYELSILPFDDACSLFVPKNPVTFPKAEVASKLEQEIDYLDELIKQMLSNQLTTIKVGEIKDARLQSRRTNSQPN